MTGEHPPMQRGLASPISQVDNIFHLVHCGQHQFHYLYSTLSAGQMKRRAAIILKNITALLNTELGMNNALM